MIQEGILKNVQKFNNIKLAKGVDLHLFVTANRTVNKQSVGISTKTYGDKWFVTPKGKALFKTFDSNYAKNIRNIRIINELVCKELCDQIGLSCAEYELAEINGINGLLTYDISDGKKLVSLSKFMSISKKLSPNVFDCSVAIDKYIDKGYRANKKNIITAMYKTILFDTLTMQTDRNIHNFNFLYDTKNKEFLPAKLIDNEFAFCGELVSNWIENDYIDKFVMHDIIYEYNMTSKILTFDSFYFASTKHLRKNIEYLVLYAKKYPSLMTILNDTLNKIDTNLAFKNVEKQGLHINEYYRDFVSMLVTNIKQMILNEKVKRIAREDLADIDKIY